MGYESSWSDTRPDTIVVTATPPKTWEQFHKASDVAFEMAQTHEGSVGIIIDLRAAPEPAGRNVLSNLRQEVIRLPSNVVVVVAVGYDMTGRTFLDILTRVFGSTYRIADTMDEAYELIAKRVEIET